ncbi:inositol monophosphatase 3, partial [Paragonimus westermani]
SAEPHFRTNYASQPLFLDMAVFRLNKQGWLVVLISVAVFLLYYFSDRHKVTRLRGDVVNVRKLLIHCVHLSEDSGSVIKSALKSSALNTRVKDPAGGPKNELLTDIDLKSHHVLAYGIGNAFPGVKIISEEHPPLSVNDPNPARAQFHSDVESRLQDSEFFVPASELAIWIDPLDATQELTEGLLEYVTVMICVALRGFPIIGVIHQPFLNRTYWAWHGHGISTDVVVALANATKMPAPTDGQPLVITHSRSHLDEKDTKLVVDTFAPQPVRLLPAGGSGFKVLSLISGQAKLYIHPSSTRRWDICAAQAVLEAVGGRMTGLDGSRLSYEGHMPAQVPRSIGLYAASSVTLHSQWIDQVTQLASQLSKST